MKSVNDVIDTYYKTIQIISNKYLDELIINRNNIDKTFNLFSDDESKYLFAQELLLCIFSNFLNKDKPSIYSGLMSIKYFNLLCDSIIKNNIYPEIIYPNLPDAKKVITHFKASTFLLHQYTYKDIVCIENGDICFDIGACLGDTSIYMNKYGAKDIYAFEIDKENIKCLKQTLFNLSIHDNVKIIQKAISNNECNMYYTPVEKNIGAGYISNIKSQNSYLINITTIDNFCEVENIIPTFIKMDIEGAELDAINGAHNIISQYNPKLAISIYHKWQHRWQIPLKINEIYPNYKFYLKKSHPTYETVLFCKK